MESKKIKEILKQFEGSSTYKKIFINGSWGIGKSYYTNEYKKENPDNIVYISLFGKNNYESIEDAITLELMNKLDKIDKLKKKAEEFKEKISISFSAFGISINSPEFNKKNIFEKFSELLEDDNLLIIIDDLERKSRNVAIEDIMGMIEQFSLFNNIKLLVIGAEDNMAKSDKEKWKKFKEKLVEKEYHITTFSTDAIESIVIKKLEKYINKDNLSKFAKTFLEIHKTKNLRSIEKGVNLFLEVVEIYLKEKYDEETYLSILKNCMSVAIEFSEGLYRPKEIEKNKDMKFETSLAYSIDSDIHSRIIAHYFHSIFMSSKESSILEYVIKIFNGEIDEDTVENFNNVVKNYLSIKDEKNLFYLSKEKIEDKIKERYDNILKGNYTYTTLEKFIDDIHELVCWSLDLELEFDFSAISERFNEILFNNYYSIDKEEYQNKIEGFNLKQQDSKETRKLIEDYNKISVQKYTKDKINRIVSKYKENNFNKKYLEWLDWKLIQQDCKEAINHFATCCRENNFLLPDLSNEIDENKWSWVHTIWRIFYEKMPEKDKKELNDYVESRKKDKIFNSRIKALQEYRPLIADKKAKSV